jgi:hypothetical protein
MGRNTDVQRDGEECRVVLTLHSPLTSPFTHVFDKNLDVTTDKLIR